MREIISIHVGQAGVRIGNACWELFCKEHNIQPDGTVSEKDLKEFPDNTMHSSFFSEDSKGNFWPRSLFVDLEPSIIDEIRTGSHRDFFDSQYLLSGKEDASNVYYRGAFTAGASVREDALNKIRKLTENCDSFGGFIFTHSISGGTGSGLGGQLIQRLEADYSCKVPKQSFALFPAPDLSDIVIESINAAMSMQALTNYANYAQSVIMLDNQALYNICSEHLNIESPTYTNVNRLIAQLISSSTVSMKFSGSPLNCNLEEFGTNLVPFSDLHFLIPSLAPLIDINKKYHKQPDLEKIKESALKPGSLFSSCKISQGKYMACSMMYRGDVTPKEVLSVINEERMRRDLTFVDWIPTGFKTGICSKAMIGNEDMRGVSRSLCMMSNSTAVIKPFEHLLQKYDMLVDRRAFAFWYRMENMEDSDFSWCQDSLQSLITDYKGVGSE